jgi:hypothetical protein
MASKNVQASDIFIERGDSNVDGRRSSIEDDSLSGKSEKRKRTSRKAIANFLYNPRKQTVLGRDALNWGK